MAILYPVLVKITSAIEKMVSIVAPHRCLGCGIEDNTLCDDCCHKHIRVPASFCVVCGASSPGWRVHEGCRGGSGLASVEVGGLYEGLLEQLIRQLKFKRVRGAAEPLAKLLTERLSRRDWLVVPLPTAPGRARQRGYDQAELIAGCLANKLDLPFSALLGRAHDSRQVGSGRQERQTQMQTAFYLASRRKLSSLNILLVDDVCTTGASLLAASKLLSGGGAASVAAVVCAWKAPDADKVNV